MRIKFYSSWFILYCRLPNMRISACVYSHAYFLRYAKNKYGHGHGMQAFTYNKIFLLFDVTRLLSVVVMLLAVEAFNLRSVFTKIKTFSFYTNAINFFCNQFWDRLFGNFYKVSKTRPKVLD